jgi:hypothetical protein
MKPKSLVILALVTLALVVAAMLSLRSREAARAPSQVEELLLPDLSARVNEVAELSVEKTAQKATLVRAGDAWTCAEASGYPADFNKVRSTLVALARLKIVEPMTKDPAGHKRLGVDAESGARVALKDASGTVVSDVIVGEAVYARSGQRVYARRADSDQTYLCEGDLTLSGDPLTWIQRDIVKVDASRMSRIEIAHQDGEVLRARKALPASPNWDVEDVPADKTLKTTGIANSLGTALSYLSLDAVKPASELPLGVSHAATASYRTFDGLIVDVRVARVEDATWLTLGARFEEPAAPAGPVVPPAEVEGAPEAAPEGEPAPTATAEAEAAAAKTAEVRKEAEELEQRLSGWAFQVPQYKADLFLKRMADLLAEPAPPAEVPLEPPEAGAPPSEGEPAPPPLPPIEDPAAGGG